MPGKAPGFSRLASRGCGDPLRLQLECLGRGLHYSQANADETKMLSKALKVFMLISSTVLLASAFLPVRKPNPPRSLMLLGSGLVMLAGVTRRHYADEK